MPTILIDKLLQACVKQEASDIHIAVGQPPVFRLHGRMRRLETKVLEPEDTVEDVYEPFLIQQGLLMRTPKGRVATPAAFGHLDLPVPSDGRGNALFGD